MPCKCHVQALGRGGLERSRSRLWAAARRELKAAVNEAALVLPYRGVRLPEMIAGRTYR